MCAPSPVGRRRLPSRCNVPKIVDADAKRKEILQAALLATRQQGIRGTNLQQVAAQAGISKSSIYHYFASREVLLEALIADAMACDVRCSAVADATDVPNAVEGLLALALSDLCRWASLGPVLLELLSDEHGRALHQEVRRILQDLLVRAIERGQADGTVRAGSASVLARFAIDGLEGHALRHAIGGTVPEEVESQAVLQLVLQFLCLPSQDFTGTSR